MRLPEAVKCIAECAPGKRVRAIVLEGVYELPLAPKPEPAAAETAQPRETVATLLLERDAQTRASVTQVLENVVGVVARVYETATVVKAALAVVAEGQERIAGGMQEITLALERPVKPIYDKTGKLIGAQRARK
ncbi:MAG: hypothetical protein IH604_15885 [Burkholderiales bacterium]|nr:hypothetical protein [Burkholderiales bacterium]